MNAHKNARTTPRSRALLVQRVTREGWRVRDAAIAFGISQRTVYKWLARFRQHGPAGLYDRRSVAHRRPHAVAAVWRELVRLLRQRRLVAVEIARRLPIARSTVSAMLYRGGLGRLRALSAPPVVQRYEWAQPGDLLHLDTKKLGRIERAGHRVTGNRRDSVRGAGWEYVHVAIDDCSRYGYVEVLPDEKRYTATAFLLRAVRDFRRRGVQIRRVLTDNGSAYRSRPFRKACRWLGIATKRTRPYRPQTNGKAERFIQTMLRGWAYRLPYASSSARTAALPAWLRFYNEDRPHASLQHQPPLGRLAQLSAEQRS